MVDTVEWLSDLSLLLKLRSIEMTDASGSGHPTSCCSIAEIMAVLFFNEMKYDVSSPSDPNNDRFVLSKGHAAPILYAAWAEAGLFPQADLLNLRKFTSDLEGHPTPRLNFVDVATGSLGQGLGSAAGMAYLGKYIEKSAYRVYCILGDGECAEGSVWEAAAFSSYYKLDNLVAIVDINRLGQSDVTSIQHDSDVYLKRWSAFGFHAVVVNGHSCSELLSAFALAKATTGKPTAILAMTYKGNGITNVSDIVGFHGKALGKMSEPAKAEIRALMRNKNVCGKDHSIQVPQKVLTEKKFAPILLSSPPNFQKGQVVAPRHAYGTGLLKLGEANKNVVALDADVRVSTFSSFFREKFPERFVECFIAEQNMVSVAIGLAARNRCVAFISTFAAFLSRAYDQIRMSAVSMSNINLCGSHVGVSIGEDGPSQMGLEDLAMFRAIPHCTVFYPSDAVSMEYAVQLAASTPGVTYIRSSRPECQVLYSNDEVFEVGKAKIVLDTPQPNILMIGAGVTLHEILKASSMLQEFCFKPIVVDLFTVKPIDKQTILSAARACGGRVVTVEDHYIEGGIFEAVCSALSSFEDITVRGIAISDIPRSGKPQELLEHFGISAKRIAEQVKDMNFN